ncbi:MAG: RnfABCDGE type electron transport complex subunit D [Cellulosilyticaceae bacterium]
MEKLLKVSASPHTHANHTVQSVMRDVIIALMPALLVSVWGFGLGALGVTLLTVVSCVAFEALWFKFTKQKGTVRDLSAVVTGLLLAFNLPATVPLYIPVVGAFVAIILAKALFGGIGQNFINPALAARAFLLTAYTGAMTSFGPYTGGAMADVVTGATPLALLKKGSTDALPSLWDAFVGNMNGCIGEVSALAILLGGLYLIYRKVITWHIPVCYLGTMFVVSLCSGAGAYDSFYSLLLGGAMLGAFFMATDYTTTPMTVKGQIIFAVGAGLIAGLIRLGGGYPEGVSYSILLMNLAVPLIDRYVKNKPFGRVK